MSGTSPKSDIILFLDYDNCADVLFDSAIMSRSAATPLQRSSLGEYSFWNVSQFIRELFVNKIDEIVKKHGKIDKVKLLSSRQSVRDDKASSKANYNGEAIANLEALARLLNCVFDPTLFPEDYQHSKVNLLQKHIADERGKTENALVIYYFDDFPRDMLERQISAFDRGRIKLDRTEFNAIRFNVRGISTELKKRKPNPLATIVTAYEYGKGFRVQRLNVTEYRQERTSYKKTSISILIQMLNLDKDAYTNKGYQSALLCLRQLCENDTESLIPIETFLTKGNGNLSRQSFKTRLIERFTNAVRLNLPHLETFKKTKGCCSCFSNNIYKKDLVTQFCREIKIATAAEEKGYCRLD